MNEILWDFKEDADRKSKIYEFYHLNSEHTVRTQCYNAPKMDYSIKEEPIQEERMIIDCVPYLEEIPDDGYTLKQAMMHRRTSWDFECEPLSDEQLKKFCAYSFGINDREENLKTYPSGGRLYPIEIYLIPTKKMVGKNKIFARDICLRYNVHTRNLEKQSDGDINQVDTLISATDIGGFSFEQAQFLVCLVGNPSLMKKKYHSLTYRLMQDECGHIGQNIMLSAAMCQLNVVPLGGFFEERIKQMLEIKTNNRSVLYVLAVG